MQLIGLTGGIASGKSTVAARFAQHGAIVVDADRLAREVVEPGSNALEAIRLRFGDSVIRSDGSLDRAALGTIIFSSQADRHALNEITHPAVWERATKLFAAARARDPNAIVVYEVPLLVEGNTRRAIDFTLIVVARADRETQKDRLIRLRGMTTGDAIERVTAQATDAERATVADVVIDTGGTVEDTHRQVDALWGRIVSHRV